MAALFIPGIFVSNHFKIIQRIIRKLDTLRLKARRTHTSNLARAREDGRGRWAAAEYCPQPADHAREYTNGV
jgi:hypothetical protein